MRPNWPTLASLALKASKSQLVFSFFLCVFIALIVH